MAQTLTGQQQTASIQRRKTERRGTPEWRTSPRGGSHAGAARCGGGSPARSSTAWLWPRSRAPADTPARVPVREYGWVAARLPTSRCRRRSGRVRSRRLPPPLFLPPTAGHCSVRQTRQTPVFTAFVAFPRLPSLGCSHVGAVIGGVCHVRRGVARRPPWPFGFASLGGPDPCVPARFTTCPTSWRDQRGAPPSASYPSRQPKAAGTPGSGLVCRGAASPTRSGMCRVVSGRPSRLRADDPAAARHAAGNAQEGTKASTLGFRPDQSTARQQRALAADSVGSACAAKRGEASPPVRPILKAPAH